MRTSNKGAINIVTPQELEVQAPQQSERFMNIVSSSLSQLFEYFTISSQYYGSCLYC